MKSVLNIKKHLWNMWRQYDWHWLVNFSSIDILNIMDCPIEIVKVKNY